MTNISGKITEFSALVQRFKTARIKDCVLALDLDGTLTNSQKDVTLRTKKAIFEFMAKGGTVALASGRPTPGVIPVAKKLELKDRGGYILSYDGGCIIDCPTEKLLYNKMLAPAQVSVLAAQAKAYDVNILSYEGDEIISEHPEEVYCALEARVNQMAARKVEHFDTYVTFPVVKCLMTGPGEKMAALEGVIRDAWLGELNVFRSEPFFIEITAQEVDKAASLERLLKMLGKSKQYLIACGDGLNDVSMINYAGYGVAMSNAQQAVKDVANVIAPSNDDDGVAWVVEALLEGGIKNAK